MLERISVPGLPEDSAIVAIGGGTGLSTFLKGLKQVTGKLTAVVTMADDGGSSGRLRSELGTLPPGDIRNCLVALAEDESLIGAADAIVLGPRSLFTSIIPNLLIADIADAGASASCPRIFICNVMTQPGETSGFSAADHLEALINHSRANIVDTVIVNMKMLPVETSSGSGERGVQPVEVAEGRLAGMGANVVLADLVASDDKFQHDSTKLADAIAAVSSQADNCRSPSQ